MPHLDNEQKILFKQQVREREEDLELRRKEDSRAMAAEDRAQKEMKRKKKNELKRKRAAEVSVANSKNAEKTSGSDDNVELISEITTKLQETNTIGDIKEISEKKSGEGSGENNQASPQNRDGKEAEKVRNEEL